MTHHNTYTTVRFGDVAREVTKSTRTPLEDGFECYIGLEHLDPESLKIRRWGLIEETATTFTRIFRAGQVLFGRRRAYQRKAALAEFDGICSGDIIVMEAKPDRLLPELLPFIVQTEGFYEHALSTSAGSLSPRTKWSALAKYEFPLPPMDEQRRIAELLWAVEDAIESYLIAKTELEILRQALMRDTFHLDNLAEKDQTFRTCRLGDVIEYASDGPFGSKLKTEHYTSSGARVIRLQNIDERFFNDEDKAYISLEYFHDDLSGYTIYPSDILIAGLGDDSNAVGRTCLAPDYLGPAVNKADCFCVRADKTVLDPTYLLYLLNSTYGKEQILRLAQGTTRLRINVSNLKTIPIMLPSLEMQAVIAKQFQFIDIQQVELDKHIKQTESLGKQLREELLGGINVSNPL